MIYQGGGIDPDHCSIRKNYWVYIPHTDLFMSQSLEDKLNGMRKRRFSPGFLWGIGIAFVVITILLFVNIVIHFQERREEALDSWLNLEMQIVREAARSTQSWLYYRVMDQGIPLEQAEQEILLKFIAPIHLLKSGDAWIYTPEYVIGDQSIGFPESYRGKSIAEIFEEQSLKGAWNYEEIINGVINATEGTGWYVWLPERGRDYVAWTSVRLAGQTWTIGLSTPEQEILAFAGIEQELRRTMLWTGGVAALLGIVYYMLWREQGRSQAHLKLLEHTVEERTQDLKRSETRYRTLVEQITAITYIDAVDDPSSSIYISPQTEKVLGYSPDEWIENPELWETIIHPDDREWVMEEHLRTNRTGEPFNVDYRVRHKDGRTIWVHDEAVLTEHGAGIKAWHGVIYDITERKTMEEELRYLGNHDALTGLFNRAYYETEIARLEASRSHPVSIIVADVDRLKGVNDRLGHAVGDEVLRRAASVLRNAFRAEDVVARTGGDEFGILLPETDEQAVQKALERIKKMLAKDARAGLEPPLSISLGSATCNRGESLLTALKEADDNMYRLKKKKFALVDFKT